jgi:HMG (high mobility group) box
LDATKKEKSSHFSIFRQQSPKPSFMIWFQENRAALEAEFPDADIPELTRAATKRYRSLPKENGSTGKRKMDDAEKKESGVSKLAKFGFVTE